jgi:hypothetical protein
VVDNRRRVPRPLNPYAAQCIAEEQDRDQQIHEQPQQDWRGTVGGEKAEATGDRVGDRNECHCAHDGRHVRATARGVSGLRAT